MKLLDLALPSWVRWVGFGIVGLCLLWLGLVLKGWHDDSQALPGVKAERDAARAETAQVRADLTAEAFRLAKVNEGLSDENEILRRQRESVPVRSVRLCPAARPAEQANPAAPSGGDAAATGSGVLSPEAGPGPDIGPALFALADEADELLRRYRGLQEYAAGLPEACLSQP